MRDNNLDEGKLDGLLGMEFREVDDDAAILIETKWVLLLERTCKNLCENLLTLAALQLQKLSSKAEELGGGGEAVRRGVEGFGRSLGPVLASLKIEEGGISGGGGGEGVSSPRVGGLEGGVDGGFFVKKLARLAREQCESMQQNRANEELRVWSGTQ